MMQTQTSCLCLKNIPGERAARGQRPELDPAIGHAPYPDADTPQTRPNTQAKPC